MTSEKSIATENRLNSLIGQLGSWTDPGQWWLANGQNGWTNETGDLHAAFLLLPSSIGAVNLVLTCGYLNTGTTANGTQIMGTLPGDFQPQNAPVRIPLATTGGTSAIVNVPYLFIGTNGVCSCQRVDSSVTAVAWNTIYPLNAYAF